MVHHYPVAAPSVPTTLPPPRISPLLPLTTIAGSIIIRDLRLWHAGMPNRIDTIRVMLAMIHFAQWYRQRMTLRLPRGLGPVLEERSEARGSGGVGG